MRLLWSKKLFRIWPLILFLALGLSAVGSARGQVEHVQITHPVYSFLLRAETRGFLPHFSLSALPLQWKEIVGALKQIRNHQKELSAAETEILLRYEAEFEITKRKNAVIIYSKSDSTPLFFDNLTSNDEKLIYHFRDEKNSVRIYPLGSVDFNYRRENGNTNRNVTIASGGLRAFGTIDNSVGYYLQATNGSVLGGSREMALEDTKLSQSIKFRKLNSDIDFTESHIRYDNDWFYGIIGRESRLLGAGLNQRLFLSTTAPPFDAVSVGARFTNFEYRFTHGSLLALPETKFDVGISTEPPSKYVAIHRFAFKPEWGEIALWESVVYSGRGVDLAYLNPLSFFKSLEHSLRDRDNSMMGFDATVRPMDGLQLKGSFLLDDIIFSNIGKKMWNNKTGWNIAAIAALPYSIDFGLEYSRIEPYTFSHFNPQNAMTNDSLLFGSVLLPNSDQIAAKFRWWWGNRYPLEINVSFTRHGNNIYDTNDSLVVNVGSDPNISRRNGVDSETLNFLDGRLDQIFTFEIKSGWEVVRGFNLHASYMYRNINGRYYNGVRLIFRYEDF